MLKLSQNALSMLISKYKAVLKNMSLKNSAALLLCASLFCASPALAEAGQTIEINGTVNHFVYGNGDIADNGRDNSPSPALTDPNGNTVAVIGEAKGGVCGGYFWNYSGSASSGNHVTVSGTVTASVTGSHAYSYSGSAAATGNIVTINGGSVAAVFGGQAQSDSDSAAASGNTVSISGGSVVSIFSGGNATGSISASAAGNRVIISDGTVGGDVYGGRAAANTGTGAATGNTVTISGGTVGGDVYGGCVYGHNIVSATNNTVTISGAPALNGSLYGGAIIWGSSAGTVDVFTGNTLNVKTGGIAVGGDVKDFQFLNFYVPPAMGGGGVMLNVAGEADVAGSTVNVGIEGGSSQLKVGDRIVLIDAGTLTGMPDNSAANGQGMQGVTLLYDFDLQAQSNQLLAQVTSVGVNPQAKAFSEGRAAALSFVNQGADLVSGDGLKNAWKEAKKTDGKVSFSALSSGSSRYKTGSHVDVNGISLLTGIASHRAAANGEMITGLFLEGGWSSYDSYNGFTNYSSVKGSGDTSYYGLGFLARSEKKSGAYTEGSLRFGRTKTDFASGDLQDSLGRSAGYDSSASYWGAHLGIGKIKTSGKNTLDMYGKYLFTRQGGNNVNVLGDPVSFSGSTSHRLKTGFRISREASEAVTTYAGAAYEYEFDGKSKATAYSYDIDAPGVKGSTGILELGAQWKKGTGDALELGLLGYVGKRQGISGTLQFKHAF